MKKLLVGRASLIALLVFAASGVHAQQGDLVSLTQNAPEGKAKPIPPGQQGEGAPTFPGRDSAPRCAWSTGGSSLPAAQT